VYNKDMAPHHFAKLYENKSHRHDSLSDSAVFNEAVGALCGMLYSVVTLKAFFPPRLNSAEDLSENKITMEQNSSPYQAILPGDQDETHNPL
jgi:hypothetical protein